MKVMNEVLTGKDTFRAVLKENITTVFYEERYNAIKNIDEKLAELQKE